MSHYAKWKYTQGFQTFTDNNTIISLKFLIKKKKKWLHIELFTKVPVHDTLSGCLTWDGRGAGKGHVCCPPGWSWPPGSI